MCMIRYTVFLRTQSHTVIATLFLFSYLISTLNGVFLVLRDRHAQSVTRSTVSSLQRTLAVDFVHSDHVKRQDSTVAEGTDLAVWAWASYLASEPPCLLLQQEGGIPLPDNTWTAYGRHLEECLAQSEQWTLTISIISQWSCHSRDLLIHLNLEEGDWMEDNKWRNIKLTKITFS